MMLDYISHKKRKIEKLQSRRFTLTDNYLSFE